VPNGQAKFAVMIRVAGRTLTADLNAKSLRRAVTAVNAAEPSTIAVVIQGRLEGDSILEPGIVAQAKTPKPAATEAA
jgi:hypothetical protein